MVLQVHNATKNWGGHVMLNKNCPKSLQGMENQFKASVLNFSLCWETG